MSRLYVDSFYKVFRYIREQTTRLGEMDYKPAKQQLTQFIIREL